MYKCIKIILGLRAVGNISKLYLQNMHVNKRFQHVLINETSNFYSHILLLLLLLTFLRPTSLILQLNIISCEKRGGKREKCTEVSKVHKCR